MKLSSCEKDESFYALTGIVCCQYEYYADLQKEKNLKNIQITSSAIKSVRLQLKSSFTSQVINQQQQMFYS